MILNLYAVLDEKAQAFRTMTFFQSNGVAIRQFADAVCDEKTFLHKHPQDYALYLLGSVDDETGAVTGISPVQRS